MTRRRHPSSRRPRRVVHEPDCCSCPCCFSSRRAARIRCPPPRLWCKWASRGRTSCAPWPDPRPRSGPGKGAGSAHRRRSGRRRATAAREGARAGSEAIVAATAQPCCISGAPAPAPARPSAPALVPACDLCSPEGAARRTGHAPRWLQRAAAPSSQSRTLRRCLGGGGDGDGWCPGAGGGRGRGETAWKPRGLCGWTIWLRGEALWWRLGMVWVGEGGRCEYAF